MKTRGTFLSVFMMVNDLPKPGSGITVAWVVHHATSRVMGSTQPRGSFEHKYKLSLANILHIVVYFSVLNASETAAHR